MSDSRGVTAEAEPVLRLDVAFGDREEACEPLFGGQEIVAVVIECAFADHRDQMEAALAGFSKEDRAQLLPLLRRLGRAAESTFHAATTGAEQRREE